MNSRFEKDYINNIEVSAPDMDKLWDKIASSEPGDDNITPFITAAEECGCSEKNRRINVYRTIASAAAVFTAVFCITSAMGISKDTAKMDKEQDNLSGAEANIAANDRNDSFSEEGYDEALNENNSEWVYVTECAQVRSYEQLNLSDTTDSELIGTFASGAPEEYFVEENVLMKTDLFIDCRIVSSTVRSDGVWYEAEIIHSVSLSGNNMEEETCYLTSRSPYALRKGREYLLPVCDDNGTLRIVFDNAPQIEIARDRTVICHNGWSSLCENSSYISYPQVYADDYFYDSMTITAECSLEKLFESWEALKG